MQMYGDFEGLSLIIVHCLGWCHIMTPVLVRGGNDWFNHWLWPIHGAMN